MTDNPLVEAVAMPLHPANRSDADLQRDRSPKAAQEIKRRNDMATIIPTAALRAIEDAGWKVVKKGDGELAAFGASDHACALYPGKDQAAERAAFVAGAAYESSN